MTSVSVRAAAKQAGCGHDRVWQLVTRGILGQAQQPQPQAARHGRHQLSADDVEDLAPVIRAGLATRQVAELMARDPAAVADAADHLKALAHRAMERQSSRDQRDQAA